jgi:hypothetical protein
MFIVLTSKYKLGRRCSRGVPAAVRLPPNVPDRATKREYSCQRQEKRAGIA